MAADFVMQCRPTGGIVFNDTRRIWADSERTLTEGRKENEIVKLSGAPLVD